jgi:hypothetical protein
MLKRNKKYDFSYLQPHDLFMWRYSNKVLPEAIALLQDLDFMDHERRVRCQLTSGIEIVLCSQYYDHPAGRYQWRPQSPLPDLIVYLFDPADPNFVPFVEFIGKQNDVQSHSIELNAETLERLYERVVRLLNSDRYQCEALV